MEQLIFFHDHAMLVILMIISIVTYVSFVILSGSFICSDLMEGQEV